MDVEKQQNNKKNKRTVMDIGALLVEARENKNLSAQDIATHLNLTLSVITDIEANQFKQDIPLPFIRGYLRSYAKKVNADVETLSVEFDRQTKSVDEPIQKIQVVSSFKPSRKELNSSNFLFKLFTLLIILALLGFAGWEAWKKYGAPRFNAKTTNDIQLNEINLSQSNLGNKTGLDNLEIETPDENKADLSEFESKEIDPNKFESSAGNVEQALDSQSVASSNESEFNQTAKINEAETVLPSANSGLESSEFESSGVRLTANFTFTDKCWVKVVDASGEVLAVGEKVAGKIMPLEGIAPLSVILGNPSAVELTVDGENYDLSIFSPGRSAKFELTSFNQ